MFSFYILLRQYNSKGDNNEKINITYYDYCNAR